MRFLIILLTFEISCCLDDKICQHCRCEEEKLNCSTGSISEIMTLLTEYSNTPLIEILILDKQPYFSLSSSLLSRFSNLKIARITNTKISKISRTAFVHHRLTEINLHNNGLSHITSTAFIGASYLEKLVLTGNRLSRIPVLKNTYLKEINLNGNLITSAELPDEYSETNLRIIKLSNNRISVIPKTSFISARLLSNLQLSSNPIQTIEEGALKIPTLKVVKLNFVVNTQELFCTITKDLSEIKLDVLEMKGTLTSFPKNCPLPRRIGVLNLAKTNLEEKSVKSMLEPVKEHVNILILDNCFLRGIDNLQFPQMKSLKILHLRENVIYRVPEDFFTSMQNLEELDLSKSRIEYLSKSDFVNLYNLKRLILSRVDFFTFSHDIILGMPLERLDLSGTKVNNDIKGCDTLKSIKVVLFLIEENISGCNPSYNGQCICGKTSSSEKSSNSSIVKEVILGGAGIIAIVVCGGTLVYKNRHKLKNLIQGNSMTHCAVHFNTSNDRVHIGDNSPLQSIRDGPHPLQEDQPLVHHREDAVSLSETNENVLYSYRNHYDPLLPQEPPCMAGGDSSSSLDNLLPQNTESTIALTANETEVQNEDEIDTVCGNLANHLSTKSNGSISSNGSTSSVELHGSECLLLSNEYQTLDE